MKSRDCSIPSLTEKKMEGLPKPEENVYTASLFRSDALVASSLSDAVADARVSGGFVPPQQKKKEHGVKRPARPAQPFFDDDEEEEEPSGESLGSADSDEEVDLFGYLSRFPLTKTEKIKILRKCATALAATSSVQIKKTRAIARVKDQ